MYEKSKISAAQCFPHFGNSAVSTLNLPFNVLTQSY